MTVTELICALQEIPQDRRGEDVQIYIRGELSSLLDIARVNDFDDRFTVETFDMRRRDEDV